MDLKYLWQLWNNARLAWRLLRDRRISWRAKAVLLGAVAYVILPVDFLPDTLPLLGQVDDVLLLVFAWKLFLSLCPSEVVVEHARDIAAAHIATTAHGRQRS